MIRRAAYNVRFCEMAAVTPLERQCEFGNYYPARTFVKPPPRKAAGALYAMWESAVLFGSEKDRALLTTMAKFDKMNNKNNNDLKKQW